VGAVPDGGRVQVAERLDWLSRDTLGNRPQPYEQLAAFYRRTGHDEDVPPGPAGQAAPCAYDPEPARADLQLAAGLDCRLRLPALAGGGLARRAAAVGTAVFTIDPPKLIPGGPAPPFHAFTYTLDLLIPLRTFGLRGAYAPPARPIGSRSP
jgi:hypothetical protein